LPVKKSIRSGSCTDSLSSDIDWVRVVRLTGQRHDLREKPASSKLKASSSSSRTKKAALALCSLPGLELPQPSASHRIVRSDTRVALFYGTMLPGCGEVKYRSID
jgi:hypothetical protein